jgi:EAL domain-containing protein (putative c-di-GMP-specific phosphodiesterase class I)
VHVAGSVPPRFHEGEPTALDHLLSRIGHELSARKELGLLSVTVVQRWEQPPGEDWDDYEAVRREITVFLGTFSRRSLRRHDLVLEPLISGNTFVVLLGPPRQERPLEHGDAARVRERLLRGLEHHLARCLRASAEARFRVCVGASIVRHEASVEVSRLIYRALEQSITDAVARGARESRQNTNLLRPILEGQTVQAVYQPLVDVVDRRILGFEALTRVPDSPFRTPDLLFRAAEEAGALWTLERLCRRRALETHPVAGGGELLFLNVERDSFRDPELIGPSFRDELERVSLEPSQVVLELTEHTLIRDFAAFRARLRACRERGFRLAMDDVGTGYCGLQAIAEIQPDYLKIDMMLIRDLHSHPIKRELVATIRRFAESTNTTLIAEGVETREELESLAALGVRHVQGYLFARPGKPPVVPDWDQLTRR